MYFVPAAYVETNVAAPAMTQSSLASRKRGRCDGDDESRDFTPLSKRINNLHINNSNYSNQSTSSHEEAHSVSPAERGMEARASNEERCNGGVMGGVQQPLYNPDLNNVDNPFYYEPNKLLYYLNMERMQRSGQTFG